MCSCFIRPFESAIGDSDNGRIVLVESAEENRSFEHDVGVFADGLRLVGKVCKGDACLRFLLVNSNRHRRSLGMRAFAVCNADDDNLCLGVKGENSDLTLLSRRLEVLGDFCVCEVLE